MSKPLEGRLPEGLDPVTAGRYGLWLMGLRQQQRAARRSPKPTAYIPHTLLGRTLRTILPWSIHEYPGIKQFAASVLNVCPKVAEDYLYDRPPHRLPAKHAATLSAILKDHIAVQTAMAAELDAYAATADRSGDNLRRMHANRREAAKSEAIL